MKTTGQRWQLHTPEQLADFNREVIRRQQDKLRTTVQFLEQDRTPGQNQVLWGLISDIVKADKGDTEVSVRRYIKLHFGVPILRAGDPAFQKKYDSVIRPMDYETKLKVMDILDVTSLLSFEQFDRLLKEVINHYTEQGYALAREK
jgi:hypothetical protein